jgi:hypothetical protein
MKEALGLVLWEERFKATRSALVRPGQRSRRLAARDMNPHQAVIAVARERATFHRVTARAIPIAV